MKGRCRNKGSNQTDDNVGFVAHDSEYDDLLRVSSLVDSWAQVDFVGEAVTLHT